jgi:starvation-inducible outer membrane lipoprotein|tara:strand:+ start:308 stop:643 length:336 start_codon:yes stop_codon:yes gene_type:complete
MKMKIVTLALALGLLAGCAATPSSIQPVAVSRGAYVNMPCSSLKLQMAAEVENLKTLSSSQTSSRNWDIAMNILLIPGAGALTSDSETEIGQSKGRIVVMQDEYAERCEQD